VVRVIEGIEAERSYGDSKKTIAALKSMNREPSSHNTGNRKRLL